MSICWGNRAKVYHKSNFPYALAGQLSTKLWKIVPNAAVIFQIILCKNSENLIYDNYTLSDYQEELLASGAIVKVITIEDCDLCVVTSQVIRLLAYLNPEVSTLVQCKARSYFRLLKLRRF